LIKKDVVWGVLDVDSDTLAAFDEQDKLWLEKIINLL
jgi:GAF domain-containing protein